MPAQLAPALRPRPVPRAAARARQSDHQCRSLIPQNEFERKFAFYEIRKLNAIR